MPTYEYECTKCGHTFEVMQSIKDKAALETPSVKSGFVLYALEGLECMTALRALILVCGHMCNS